MEGLTVQATCRRCGKPIGGRLDVEAHLCLACRVVTSRRVGISLSVSTPLAGRLGEKSDSPPGGQRDGAVPRRPVRKRHLAWIAPWAISLLVHLGAVVLAMTSVFVAQGVPVETVISADIVVSDPGARFDTPPLYAESGGEFLRGSPVNDRFQAKQDPHDPAPRLQGESSGRTAAAKGDSLGREAGLQDGSSRNAVDLIGVGGASAALTGVGAADSAAARQSSFFGTGAVAQHVVYVIDRSGSMLDSFDDVCRQVLTSVSRLTPAQDFHIILFSDGAAIEMPPGRLAAPTYESRLAAAEFLQAARPAHRTDPVPALRRAFDVLEAPRDGGGKVMYFLTDGLLLDSSAVLRLIAERNCDKRVHVNTYLSGGRDEAAAAVMRRIAEDNGGVFKQLNPERLEVADSAPRPGEMKE